MVPKLICPKFLFLVTILFQTKNTNNGSWQIFPQFMNPKQLVLTSSDNFHEAIIYWTDFEKRLEQMIKKYQIRLVPYSIFRRLALLMALTIIRPQNPGQFIPALHHIPVAWHRPIQEKWRYSESWHYFEKQLVPTVSTLSQTIHWVTFDQPCRTDNHCHGIMSSRWGLWYSSRVQKFDVYWTNTQDPFQRKTDPLNSFKTFWL